MKVSTHSALLALLIPLALPSCEWFNTVSAPRVPEIPYRPRRIIRPEPTQQPMQPAAQAWNTAPGSTPYIAPATPVANAVQPPATPEVRLPAAPTHEPTPTWSTGTQTIQPTAPAAPIAPPPSAPKPEKKTSAPADDEMIPTATPVPGDPTHVWNPLDPTRVIKIIDPKTNQPYKSGKRLKVRGQDGQYHFFYVP